MGIDPDRLDGPIVGIASTWTQTMPCNLNHRRLADARGGGGRGGGRRRARLQHDRGLRQPVAGHAGHARVARLARGDRRLDRADGARARLRRARLPRRLRQDRPGGADGAGAGRPARRSCSPAGRCSPGRLGERAADDPGRVGGGRRARARAARRAPSSTTIERAACPGAGYCAGNFTANTMAIVVDMLGLGVVGDGLIPAADVEEKDAAAAAGRRAGRASWRASGTTARRFLDRRALENAMAGVGRERRLDERLPAPAGDRPRGRRAAHARRPRRHQRAHAGARRPRCRAGASSPPTCTAAGGTATLIRELIRGGHVDGAAPTVDGRTLAEATADAPEPDGEVIRRASSRAASLHALRGNLAPDGAVLKLAGTERRAHTGPARVFDDEASCTEARARGRRSREGDVLVVRYEGPAGGPGMREMLGRHRRRSSAPGWASRSRS